jgi:broad specificity phosphatase PhoE
LTEKLSDKTILHFLTGFSLSEKSVAVIRHSERVSFHDVPMEKWDSVGITESGLTAAEELGRALVKDARISRVRIYSWGQRRCVETAAAISKGLVEEGASVYSSGSLSLKGPISDYGAYKEMIMTGRWQEMLDSWQKAKDVKGSLIPIAEYSPMIFREILALETSRREELRLVVTHDLHIIPLACYAMEAVVNPPDYLDGLVIGQQDSKISVGYGQLSKSVDLGFLTR